MKLKLGLGAFALAVLAACGGGGGESTVPAAPSKTTNRILVFGDSLSDGGTYTLANQAALAAAGLPAGLPIGRFTNNPGQVWVEVLAGKLGITLYNERYEYGSAFPVPPTLRAEATATNYAQGGARVVGFPGVGCFAPTDPVGPTCIRQSAVSLKIQIDRALAKGNPGDNDLVVVWGGANDVFFQVDLAAKEIARQVAAATAAGRPAAEIAAIPQLVAGSFQVKIDEAAFDLVSQMKRVQAAGAKRVLVMTLPDMGKTPAGFADPAGAGALLSAFSRSYNATLRQELARPGTNALLFDVEPLAAGYMANPAANGYTNVTVPICNVGPTSPLPAKSSQFCTALVPPFVTPGVDAATSMFADAVHPSVATHAKFGNAVHAFLQARGWVN